MAIIKLNHSNNPKNPRNMASNNINKRTIILISILLLLIVIAFVVNFIIMPESQPSEEVEVPVSQGNTHRKEIDMEDMEFARKIMENMEWREETELYRDPFFGPIELSGVLEIAIDEGGELAFLENPPVIQDGRTLVPLQEIMENLEDSVHWNPKTKEIIIKREANVLLYLGEYEAEINGEIFKLDVPPQIIDDKIMVPLRFISEKLGLIVNYDDDGRKITISVN
ncbi:copper amine oxidase N-terminal domain-containing protein [Natranaerobius trueperi]|uniref:Copper amine oxidase-like N-terminal domain-containing protein n=1 Tax=Natranaerobius trueperi TaxID=759412 RepID=A0A226C061_9FIRM|nr:copper amine oxidase N-terminal domain-containing protein [Natranaerobius trueperi]OWZ84643.1 hypothetical protein CDO51_02460 [Natranaerobius trueperi]